MSRILGALARILREGVDAGRFQPVNPLLVHAAIVGPLLLYFASHQLRRRLSARGIPAAASSVARRSGRARAEAGVDGRGRTDSMKRVRADIVSGARSGPDGRGVRRPCRGRTRNARRDTWKPPTSASHPLVGGRLIEVAVAEGDRVAAGALVARLDTADTELALRRAEADRDQAVAALKLLEAGPAPRISGRRTRKPQSAQADVAAAHRNCSPQPPIFSVSKPCCSRTPDRASSETMRRRAGTWRLPGVNVRARAGARRRRAVARLRAGARPRGNRWRPRASRRRRCPDRDARKVWPTRC